MSGSSSSRPRKNASKTTCNSNAEVKRRGNVDITNNWPLQLTSDNDPTPSYDELNRVDILPDGWVYISVGSEEIANRDELQCRGSLDKVLKWYRWIVVYPTLKKLVDGMGFADFCSINAGNSDNRLIHALVERWWPSTHTFHFPCGELGFTPLDFVMLTGISFGRGRELPYDEGYSKLEEATNMFPGITSFDMSATSIRVGYLAALIDYDILGASGFDWGTPIMAALYQGLDEVSVLRPEKVKKSITGFYAVLEYCQVGMYLVKVPNFNHIYPRISGWRDERASTEAEIHHSFAVIRDMIEWKDKTNIDWQPWHRSTKLRRLEVRVASTLSTQRVPLVSVPYGHGTLWYLEDRCMRQMTRLDSVPYDPPQEIINYQGCTLVKRTRNIWSVGRDLVRPNVILPPTSSLATSSQVQDYGVQETDDPRDMGWFMDGAGPNDQRRRIPIPVMQVPYPCPPAYSTDELWHQNQGLRYAAYEDSRQLTDNNIELRKELSQAQEVIRETSDRLAEISISYQT
ncbi:hypothetical protein GIB67_001143 [Kingdonia uniflora]|uniref:Aminotransferase-like plant mobile domain-containing protein n=1 Tax=Kingdonia uniflora TaxID=39325 RepID=A0A7J7N3W9_9MAGN|nr:hypothetical protein GIB67_001143 [Kingdonia uniflora]